MNIILVRIPEDTTVYDITSFLEPVLKGNLFGRKGIITKVEIQILYDNLINTKEYHGLVKIEPDSVAQKVIRKLNRKPINGKYIAVREYHIRNWHNDPRLNNPQGDIDFADRRKAPRRRSHLQVIEQETVKFSSNKHFHRTF